MNKPFRCRLGFHKYIKVGEKAKSGRVVIALKCSACSDLCYPSFPDFSVDFALQTELKKEIEV